MTSSTMTTISSAGLRWAARLAATIDGAGSRTRTESAWAPRRPSTMPNSTRAPVFRRGRTLGQRAGVQEHVGAPVIVGEEAEALLRVVEPDLAGGHGPPLCRDRRSAPGTGASAKANRSHGCVLPCSGGMPGAATVPSWAAEAPRKPVDPVGEAWHGGPHGRDHRGPGGEQRDRRRTRSHELTLRGFWNALPPAGPVAALDDGGVDPGARHDAAVHDHLRARGARHPPRRGRPAHGAHRRRAPCRHRPGRRAHRPARRPRRLIWGNVAQFLGALVLAFARRSRRSSSRSPCSASASASAGRGSTR